MDGHPRERSRDRTRLTGRLAGDAPSVLVGAEDVRRRARVADAHGRIEIPDRDRDLAIRVEALHVVDALPSSVDLDQTTERAAADPVGGEPVRIGVLVRRAERESHVAWGLDVPTLLIERVPMRSPQTSTRLDGTAIRKRY